MRNRTTAIPSSAGRLRWGRRKGTGKRKTSVSSKKTWRAVDSSIVYIEWVDAVSDGSWEVLEKPDVHTVKTIGFLLCETKDALCIASTVSGEYSNARMHIPKAWITKRKVIKK